MYDVITVGSSTLDIFAKTEFSELIKIIDPKQEMDLLAYPSGSKILIEHITQSIGGSGTNAGSALALLGNKVGYIGKVGTDTTGQVITEGLKKEKIDVFVPQAKGHSGYSVILETLEHDRTILAFKGINDELKYKDIPQDKLKTKWFYFGSMMGQSFKTQERLASYARKHKIKVLFNPSNYLANRGPKYLDKVLKATTLLTLNREEASCLVGKHETPKLARRLHKLGPKIVAITDGKESVTVYADGHVYQCKPPKTKAVDCTGAGDAFAATFMHGIMNKKPVEEAMRMAVANSTSIIGHHGAKNKLLNKTDLLKRVKRQKVRVRKVTT